jgi:hypothetical protein
MPDDTKSLICEVVHEVCEWMLKHPMLWPHSPMDPIPVLPPASAAPADITPGYILCLLQRQLHCPY